MTIKGLWELASRSEVVVSFQTNIWQEIIKALAHRLSTIKKH